MSQSLKVLGIYREEKFSNRAIEADKAIMDQLFISLGQLLDLKDGSSFFRLRPEDLSNDKNLALFQSDFDLVFSMAQDEAILMRLDQLEKNGAVVINSSHAIRNCYRFKLSELLSDEAFSYPRFISLNVDQVLFKAFESPYGYWVKRGDFHALIDQDVVHINSLAELGEVLAQFKARGVEEVILQESIEGELFKFYGVKDKFFNLRYMGKTTNDRYITIPGDPLIAFNKNKLEKLVHMAAGVLELDFFGGDCIVTTDNKIHFIDFNDWPSFRTCREVVAPIMANYGLNKINKEVPLVDGLVQ